MNRRLIFLVILCCTACGVEYLPTAASQTVNTTSADVIVAATDGNSRFVAPIFTINYSDEPAHAYVLTFASYDQCAWVTANDPSSLPLNFTMLRLYLLNMKAGQIAAPVRGTYEVAKAGNSGLFIDPYASGFGRVSNCTGTWPGLMFGTVTLNQVNTQTAGGSIELTLTDGTTIVGAFQSTTCDFNAKPGPPAANTCISIH